ncbi:MAG TPA: dihydrodipicolinate synthase family protein [Bryobacteraceae bacterium]|nr:dihydrodipicolinate synthase family protein [Bryobacteraceae bacterium]
MKVIPAHPLALTAERKMDERRQRALTRYYVDAGVDGLAVGVHTTQFAIREVGLYRPVLELAMQEARGRRELTMVAGVVGPTAKAVAEAAVARDLGYHYGLLGLGALRESSIDEMVEHVRAVSEVIPVFGFYLQPAVGGRTLPFEFWRQVCDIPGVAAIKIAPFNRYQTIEVVRAVTESAREDIALYTGNDDNIVVDLLTEWNFGQGDRKLRFTGGLLGHWSVWTRKVCDLAIRLKGPATPALLTLNVQVTDANAALFDAANAFQGCIAGLHEILRRQGLLEGRWCLDPQEDLSPGQMQEIDRVCAAYPHLTDDDFVRENRDRWLS